MTFNSHHFHSIFCWLLQTNHISFATTDKSIPAFKSLLTIHDRKLDIGRPSSKTQELHKAAIQTSLAYIVVTGAAKSGFRNEPVAPVHPHTHDEKKSPYCERDFVYSFINAARNRKRTILLCVCVCVLEETGSLIYAPIRVVSCGRLKL